jgi:hypothetical protein
VVGGNCVLPTDPEGLGGEYLRIWVPARNPANPYDAVGLQHNQILASFFGSKLGQELKADLTAHKKQPPTYYLVPFFKDWPPTGTGPYAGPWPYDPWPILKFSKTVKSPDDWIGLSQKRPSQILLKYLHLLQNNIKNLPNGGVLRSQSFSSIISLEAAIAADKAVSASDKKTLLMAASVARYSCAYWHDPKNQWVGAKSHVEWGQVCGVDAIVGGFTTPAGGATGSAIDAIVQWIW